MQAQIISFHCVLTDKVGTVISSTFNRDVITEGKNGFLKGLSEGLRDLKAGEKRIINLTASEAYGFYDPSLVREVPLKKFPLGSQFAIGDQVVIPLRGGKLKTYRVVKASQKVVCLDGNHPLAGHDLTFEVDGVQSREATSEEVAECFPDVQSRMYN